MNEKLQNKVVLITGASAGIGKATAVGLAQAGADVVLTARRAERLHKLVDDLAIYPGRRLALAGDIRDQTFCNQLIKATAATFGRLDVLINNAGIGHRSPLLALSSDDINTIWETNVTALLLLSQAAAQQMQQQNSGQIINVSSIVSQRPLPQNGVYCASKTAVNFLSRSLRMELRPYHIQVTLVYPGLTATEFGAARLGAKGPNKLGLSGVPAEKVAHKIIAAIENGRSEVYITWYDWLFTHINRLFPRSIDWLIARGANRML